MQEIVRKMVSPIGADRLASLENAFILAVITYPEPNKIIAGRDRQGADVVIDPGRPQFAYLFET